MALPLERNEFTATVAAWPLERREAVDIALSVDGLTVAGTSRRAPPVRSQAALRKEGRCEDGSRKALHSVNSHQRAGVVARLDVAREQFRAGFATRLG